VDLHWWKSRLRRRCAPFHATVWMSSLLCWLYVHVLSFCCVCATNQLVYDAGLCLGVGAIFYDVSRLSRWTLFTVVATQRTKQL
jgi:hypothetical protein